MEGAALGSLQKADFVTMCRGVVGIVGIKVSKALFLLVTKGRFLLKSYRIPVPLAHGIMNGNWNSSVYQMLAIFS